MSEMDAEITARLAEIGVPDPVPGPVEWRTLPEMPEIQEAARMSRPDIQYFAESGTWVKPEDAVRVDVVLQGVVGKFGGAHLGLLINPNGYGGFDGEPGEIRASSFDAPELPDAVEVEVGKSSWPGVGEGSWPGGRDGYALIITHLSDEEGGQR